MSGVAYGVRLNCDIALDHLPQADFEGPAISIDVHRTPTPPEPEGILISTYTAQDRVAKFYIHDSHATISLDSLFRFRLWLDTAHISCHVPPDASESLIRYWILQQVLPIFLLLAGKHDLLHGTAVTIEAVDKSSSTNGSSRLHAASVPECVAFLGPSRSGKSTLLNFFLSRGHGLVTDDHLALSGEDYTTVSPSTPYYRPYRGVEDLGLVSENYSSGPKELRRLYVLWPVPADAPIAMERMTGAEAIAVLIADNHYTLHDSGVPRFQTLFEKRFRGLAGLSRKIPVIKLHVPRSLDRLPELYTHILQDLAS